jgi:hypothetical protein
MVGWRDDAGRQWNVTVALPYETSLAQDGQPLSLVYQIHPAGQVTVRLEPSP